MGEMAGRKLVNTATKVTLLGTDWALTFCQASGQAPFLK